MTFPWLFHDFQGFSMTYVVFHDFPGPVVTLLKINSAWEW